MKHCINCNSNLVGPYCHHCGEKIVNDNDLNLRMLIEQVVDVFTHVDSKLIATFKSLLVHPGLLSTSYVQGLRKPFMKPFQIFVLTNVLFFFLLSDVDVFRKPSSWWFELKSDMGLDIQQIVSNTAEKYHLTKQEVALAYDLKSKTMAKALVVIFIPFLGLIFSILFIKRNYQLGKHIVFSTHLFSFVLLIMIIWTEVINLFGNHWNSRYYVIPIQIAWLLYFYIAIRKFYKTNIAYSALATLLGLVLLNVTIEFYRFGISIYSLLNAIHS